MTESGQGLFISLQNEFDRNLQKQKLESKCHLLEMPSNQLHDMGHRLFAEMRDGGFCTFVVAGKTTWDPTHHYHQAARTAAARGRKIHRAFLLPMKAAIHNSSLREHLRLDMAAGIETSVLYVGDLISTGAIPAVPSLEFGIWDNEVACVALSHEPSALGLRDSEWRISRRREDIETFGSLRDLLLSHGSDLQPFIDGAQQVANLEEPMLTTAPLARELAPVLCKGGSTAHEDCSWYHSAWQFLRIFNMVSTPTWHQSFYLNTLKSLAVGQEHSRIFISGSADYSTLAHVLWAYNEVKAPCDVVVADLCETPILLCKWYAKYVGKEIDAFKKDIFQIKTAIPFDLIVTDAFVTRFEPAVRIKLMSKWNELLRVGGRAVTTVRIESRSGEEAVKSSITEVSDFRKRATREARKWRSFLEISEEEVAQLAQRYAERMVSSSLRSADEVRALFETAGFTCTVEIADVPGETRASKYARVVAEKVSGYPAR